MAENTSDGVIAPLFYLALGGPVLGWVYKAVNTMDSMVGYKNEAYLYFGRAAAKLDDLANFLPARLSAGLMVLAAAVLAVLGIGAVKVLGGSEPSLPTAATVTPVRKEIQNRLSVSVRFPALTAWTWYPISMQRCWRSL